MGNIFSYGSKRGIVDGNANRRDESKVAPGEDPPAERISEKHNISNLPPSASTDSFPNVTPSAPNTRSDRNIVRTDIGDENAKERDKSVIAPGEDTAAEAAGNNESSLPSALSSKYSFPNVVPSASNIRSHHDIVPSDIGDENAKERDKSVIARRIEDPAAEVAGNDASSLPPSALSSRYSFPNVISSASNIRSYHYISRYDVGDKSTKERDKSVIAPGKDPATEVAGNSASSLRPSALSSRYSFPNVISSTPKTRSAHDIVRSDIGDENAKERDKSVIAGLIEDPSAKAAGNDASSLPSALSSKYSFPNVISSAPETRSDHDIVRSNIGDENAKERDKRVISGRIEDPAAEAAGNNASSLPPPLSSTHSFPNMRPPAFDETSDDDMDEDAQNVGTRLQHTRSDGHQSRPSKKRRSKEISSCAANTPNSIKRHRTAMSTATPSADKSTSSRSSSVSKPLFTSGDSVAVPQKGTAAAPTAIRPSVKVHVAFKVAGGGVKWYEGVVHKRCRKRWKVIYKDGTEYSQTFDPKSRFTTVYGCGRREKYEYHLDSENPIVRDAEERSAKQKCLPRAQRVEANRADAECVVKEMTNADRIAQERAKLHDAVQASTKVKCLVKKRTRTEPVAKKKKKKAKRLAQANRKTERVVKQTGGATAIARKSTVRKASKCAQSNDERSMVARIALNREASQRWNRDYAWKKRRKREAQLKRKRAEAFVAATKSTSAAATRATREPRYFDLTNDSDSSDEDPMNDSPSPSEDEKSPAVSTSRACTPPSVQNQATTTEESAEGHHSSVISQIVKKQL